MIDKRIIPIFLLMILAMGMISQVSASDSAFGTSNASVAITEDIADDNVVIAQNGNDTPLMASKSSGKATFTQLQNQLNKAPEGSTIVLTKDYSYDDDFKGRNGITITRQIIIDGKGHSIDGLSKSPLILIGNASNVVLKNLVFKNGYNRNAGVVSAVGSANIEFNNCRFVENEAGSAAVYLGDDSKVRFVKCSFEANLAHRLGGAVLSTDTDGLSFVSCDFNLNKAKATGGAVYLSGSDGSYFESCRFVDNRASDGGAVYASDSNALRFVKCVFKDNDASYTGGAIYSARNMNSRFESCQFYLNVAEDAGAIYSCDDVNSHFSSCDFNSNSAYSWGGAAYLNRSGFSFDFCGFNDNHASTGGAVGSVQSSLNVFKSGFAGNSAKSSGGDISSRWGMIHLADSSFHNSSAKGAFGGSLGFTHDYAEIVNCTFENCRCPDNDGGAVHGSNSILYCINSSFKSNEANYGGAICSLDCELTILNDTFHNNTALNYGGSIYSIYGSLTVSDSIFSFSSGYYGGCMYIRSPHVIRGISNNYFLYSSAYSAPRIYIDEYYGDIPESGNVYEDVYFVVGNFTGYGDRIYNYSNVLVYVLSSEDAPINDMSYYDKLRDSFVSRWNYNTPSDLDENITVNICDDGNPNSSTVFLSYESFESLFISYDASHSPHGFDWSLLDIGLYDFANNRLSYLTVYPYIYDVRGSSYFMSNTTKLNGWFSWPVFDDNVTVDYLTRSYFEDEFYGCFVDIDTYDSSNDYANGKFYFVLEDYNLFSNFGNVYGFKGDYNPVPTLNYNYLDEFLPSCYDARDYGYVTPVVDQMEGQNCWVFAGIATLETCLKKVTGKEYDFSENNAKNLMAVSSVYGMNLDVNGGGYDTMFMSYLASWLGPVDEGYDRYDDSSLLSIAYPIMFHIHDISFLSPRKNSLDNDEFKEAILKYGAVAVILDWTVNNVSTGFHSVSLIGWDDNYNGYDCLGNYARGAWIFKNSWGEGWGDEGFGYLSYDQRISGEIEPYMHAYTFVFNDDEFGYQNVYQYDFAGVTDYLCTGNNLVSYKNRFIAKDYEFLYAFSTYFEKPTYFTFSVCINGQQVIRDENNRWIENSIHYSPAGYHTIPLGYNLTLKKGDEFEIIISLVDGESYVPVCQAEELYNLIYPSNVSFVSYNGGDWIDLYDLNSTNMFAYGGNKTGTCQVACIKAFTANWKMGYANPDSSGFMMQLLVDRGWNAVYFNPDGSIGGDYFRFGLYVDSFDRVRPNEEITITMGVGQWYGYNEGYENLIEININDRTYYASLYKGREVPYANYYIAYANLNITFEEEGYYEFSAKLKSTCFDSRTVKFGFVVSDDYDFANLTELKQTIQNAEEGSVIFLDRNYYCDEEFDGFIYITKSLTIDGDWHCLYGLPKLSFIISPDCNVVLKNIEFKNAKCNGDYSLISSEGNLTIMDCAFINNKAQNGMGIIRSSGECHISDTIFESNFAELGGAIFIEKGICSIDNTMFYDNHALECGGAIFIENGACNINYSDFYENGAGDCGGAVYATGLSDLAVASSNFLDNVASKNGADIYSKGILNVTDCDFESDEVREAIYFSAFDANANLNLKNNRMLVKSAAVWYDENEIPYLRQLHLVFTDKSVVKGKNCYICKIVDDEGNSFRMGDVNVAMVNGNNVINIKVGYDSILGGYVLDTSSIAYGTYATTGKLSAACKYDVRKGTLKIVKKSVIIASSLTKTYATGKKLALSLRDDKGKAIANAYLKVKISSRTYTLKTNAKGKAALSLNQVPKTYPVKISYKGSDKYSSASKNVKVTVRKATPKMAASARAFKAVAKTKKYRIVLKNNLKKAMKAKTVKIKVNGKLYSAKTNRKGIATFNLNKLTKKGKFKATITYGGDRCYNRITKTAIITVKK